MIAGFHFLYATFPKSTGTYNSLVYLSNLYERSIHYLRIILINSLPKIKILVGSAYF